MTNFIAETHTVHSGGGIAGLTLAITLGNLSGKHVVDIYESSKTYTEIGAGISTSKRIWETLERLGLTEDLKPFANTSG